MTISEVSKMINLTQYTLRYYEKVGIIPKVKRIKNGIRDYSEEDCRWLEFAKCMRSAGLSVEVIIEYINLMHKGNKTISTRKNLLVEERRKLQEKIDDMQKTMERLDCKIKLY